jgi:hypothetical protein
VPGDSLINNSNFGDYDAEVNDYRTIGDGARIETTVAAFWYDMVDGPSDPDGFSNETGVDDDHVTWPGGYVSDVISKCSVLLAGTWIGKMDGIDEFIYCAEHDIAGPRAANPFGSFRSFSSFQETAAEPTGWSAATVRSLWRYNLYNLGSLP